MAQKYKMPKKYSTPRKYKGKCERCGIKTDDYYDSGMHYIVFSNASGITVINLTKDELECKVLRKQLK